MWSPSLQRDRSIVQPQTSSLIQQCLQFSVQSTSSLERVLPHRFHIITIMNIAMLDRYRISRISRFIWASFPTYASLSSTLWYKVRARICLRVVDIRILGWTDDRCLDLSDLNIATRCPYSATYKILLVDNRPQRTPPWWADLVVRSLLSHSIWFLHSSGCYWGWSLFTTLYNRIIPSTSSLPGEFYATE